jgi:hypothetical protein
VRFTLNAAILFAISFAFPVHASPFTLTQGFRDVRAYVTGYNTVAGQTDDTPCIAASGADICGRTNAVACPRAIGLGTILQIRGMLYICEDRLARKYDSRFDISCDKNTTCPPLVTGWTVIRVFALRATPQISADRPVPGDELISAVEPVPAALPLLPAVFQTAW